MNSAKTPRETKYRKYRRRKRLRRILQVLFLIALIAASVFYLHRDRQQNDASHSQSNSGGTVQTDASVQGDASSLPYPSAAGSDGSLRVWFLDVGEGDAILVTCGGETMLVDAGPAAAGDSAIAFLRSERIDHLNILVATHPHEDHIGGIPAVLSAVSAEYLLTPVTENDSGAFRAMTAAAGKQGLAYTRASAGMQFSLGKGSETAKITVLGPIDQSGAIPDNINNLSVVLRIDYGETSFLLTGDAEYDELQDITDHTTPELLRCDVLKAAHHGSNDAGCFAFLEAASPQYAVISCGRDNEHGHPHGRLLGMLEDLDVQLLRTDLNGTILFESDGHKISANAERAAAYAQLWSAGTFPKDE